MLAPFAVPAEDRNRTSLFPYGGHRFEFRAVGSSQVRIFVVRGSLFHYVAHFTGCLLSTLIFQSDWAFSIFNDHILTSSSSFTPQNVSLVNTVLASIAADSFREFSEAIEAGRTPKEVAQQALRDAWKVSARVIACLCNDHLHDFLSCAAVARISYTS